jgi:hypothetical protein
MPLTKCCYCRRIQIIKREMLGKELGCLNAHCERPFVAYEYFRHRGILSQLVFYGVIVFALYLAITFWGGHYVNHLKHILKLMI